MESKECESINSPGYSTLSRAQNECNKDPLCTSIDDLYCERNRWYLCNGGLITPWYDLARDTCSWQKGTERKTSYFSKALYLRSIIFNTFMLLHFYDQF